MGERLAGYECSRFGGVGYMAHCAMDGENDFRFIG
ncbi:hypothetical protein BAZSYMA_ACONTIG08627_0 [Bathymodiolus azoricus thioautotrophic gill symbiont]|uniref:Uncharacterized protein n=1 Tax=Bathymodiolus azoricus thioautotrophic gill symbiont TaxID=235205 RepID=A0A1H6KJ22_9GAMM|nr:hypothetical protein BAZSYMA_ACONTIG08627_0 [Bathymodiolus azoricus thioautotrophic gill symbiont]